jgi:hypothetical protein
VTESGADAGPGANGHQLAGEDVAQEHAQRLPGAAGSDPDVPEAPAVDLPRWQPFADMAAPPAGHVPPSATGMPPGEVPASPAESALPTRDDAAGAPEVATDGGEVDGPATTGTPGWMTPGDTDRVPPSQWIVTPPQAAPRRTGLLAVGAAVVGILVAGALLVGALGLLPNDKGRILFGTAAGRDLCSVGRQTDTVTTADPVYFAAVLKHQLGGDQAITFRITKDGTEFVTHPEPADGKAFDCYGSQEPLGTLPAGSYVFEVIHGDEVDATGRLTVR